MWTDIQTSWTRRLALTLLVVVVGVLLGLTLRTAAHPQYAQRTQLTCIACHQSPSGGRSLTPLGDMFKASGYQWPLPEDGPRGPILPLADAVRTVMRVLHFSTLVAWLGAIFVIHIIIGPQVASRGIPRAYLLLAWPAMGLILISGVFLTLARLTAWNDLVDTRWGIILIVKMGLFLAMMLSATFETLWVSPRLRKLGQLADETPVDPLLLVRGDGLDGRPTYVRHEGTVYDLSSSSAWQGGLHMARHWAGQDLTESLLEAPHSSALLTRFPTVETQGDSRAYRRLLRLHIVLARSVIALGFGALLATAFWT